MIIYDLEKLDTDEFKVDGHEYFNTPIVVLVDNKATVQMSKNYKMSKRNRHILRRFHYVREGEKLKRHTLKWISNEDMLADENTKTQEASKIRPQRDRTFVKIADFLEGSKKKE